MLTEAEIRELSDVELVYRVLPAGWRQKAVELGALARRRIFPSAEVLLRVLLLHVAGGFSLRQTAAMARQSGLVSVSDVALQYRLGCALEWLAWMTVRMMDDWLPRASQPSLPAGRQVRLLDATCVREPGPTGSLWRLHYAVAVPAMRSAEVKVTDVHTGETFKNFAVTKGDVLVADAGYSNAPGMADVVARGGDVVVRLNPASVHLTGGPNRPFNLLRRVQQLGARELGDWPAELRAAKSPAVSGRVCAVRLSAAAAAEARRKVTDAATKRGTTPLPTTLKLADFLCVFTTLPAVSLTSAQTLELYRGRWQIELVFKRLKSLVGLGHLPKHEAATSQAWLQGKLLTAFIIEALLTIGESFFPWGYPLLPVQPSSSLALAGG